MKKLARAALAVCLSLSVAVPSFAQTLYTVQVWDQQVPPKPQTRVTTIAVAAAALVQAGVATPVDLSQYNFLATYPVSFGTASTVTAGALDYSSATNSAFIL